MRKKPLTKMDSENIKTQMQTFVSLIDKPFEECVCDINDIMENTIQWFDELEVKLQNNELERKKPKYGGVKIKTEDVSMIQYIKVPEEDMQSFLDDVKENIPTRRVTRQMNAQMSLAGRKRSAELPTTTRDSKRMKSVISNEVSSDEAFKKPETRSRGRKEKEPMSVIDPSHGRTMIIDSHLGVAVCHSSPKVSPKSTRENTYTIPKMSCHIFAVTPGPKDRFFQGERQNVSLWKSASSSPHVASPLPLMENNLRSIKRSLSGANHSPDASRHDFSLSTEDDNCPCPTESVLETSKKESAVESTVTLWTGKNSSSNDNGCPERMSSNALIPPLSIKQERLTADVELEVTSGAVRSDATFTKNKLSKVGEIELFAGKLRKSVLSTLARKSLSKAKRILNEREQLQTRLQSPISRIRGENLLPINAVPAAISSNTKLRVVLSENKRQLTPRGKGKLKQKSKDEMKKNCKAFVTPAKTGGENSDVIVKSWAKHATEDLMEKELKLKALREKEEGAVNKKLEVIRSKQLKLKLKNEVKSKSATKQRQKLEMEKHKNMVLAGKEKEARHRQQLEGKKLKEREGAMERKRIREQKTAQTEKRRRLEEGIRIAKSKEQEAEKQRLMLEKQKELERHERLIRTEQKAKIKYEMQTREEREKMVAVGTAAKGCPQQVHSSAKPQTRRIQIKEWNYEPRNENDLGLEYENSDVESNDEETGMMWRIPLWAKRFLKQRSHNFTREPVPSMTAFMSCETTTPDIQRMFRMSPQKKIKRTSSAIWSTPSS